MKKLKLIILLMFITFIGFSQVKYYPGVNRFTQNLTVTSTGSFIVGIDTVTSIMEDTLTNPAWIRAYVSTTDSLYWTISGDTLYASKNYVSANKLILDTLYMSSTNVTTVLGDTLADNTYVQFSIADSINNYMTYSPDTTYLVRENLVVDNCFYDSLFSNRAGLSRAVIDTMVMGGEEVIFVYGDSLVDDDYVNDTLDGYYTKLEINDTLTDYYLSSKINDSLADYYLSTVCDDTIRAYIHDSLTGYYTKLEINDTLTDYFLKTDTLITPSGGYLGIGSVSTLTKTISLSGQADKSIGMERNITADTEGKNLTINAGSSTLGSTDKNGGNLTLKGGSSTGAGETTVIIQGAFKDSVTNTTTNSFYDRIIVPSRNYLTDNVAVGVLNITSDTSRTIGGVIDFTIHCTEGIERQTYTGTLLYGGVYKKGVITKDGKILDSLVVVTSGTLTCAISFDTVTNENTYSIIPKITANSNLTALAILYVEFIVKNNCYGTVTY